jgi:hypothetical protein
MCGSQEDPLEAIATDASPRVRSTSETVFGAAQVKFHVAPRSSTQSRSTWPERAMDLFKPFSSAASTAAEQPQPLTVACRAARNVDEA